jgi:hypothetical protein
MNWDRESSETRHCSASNGNPVSKLIARERGNKSGLPGQLPAGIEESILESDELAEIRSRIGLADVTGGNLQRQGTVARLMATQCRSLLPEKGAIREQEPRRILPRL